MGCSEAGRRSRKSGTDGDEPFSAGMRVASRGELVSSEGFERVGDLGAGDVWMGGGALVVGPEVSVAVDKISQTETLRFGKHVLALPGACNTRGA